LPIDEPEERSLPSKMQSGWDMPVTRVAALLEIVIAGYTYSQNWMREVLKG